MAFAPHSLPLYSLSVGDGIVIHRDGDRNWHPAEIMAAEGDHRCEVLYGDGEREWLSLDETRFIVQRDSPASARARSQAKRPKAEPAAQLDEIKDILLDIEDRLPFGGVYEKEKEWWKVWRDGILVVVKKNDIQGLIEATLSLSLQLKPNITSTWWVRHSADWKMRIRNSGTILEAALAVKELQNKAINWSMAGKLFAEESLDVYVGNLENESKARDNKDDLGSNVTVPHNCSKLPASSAMPVADTTVELTSDCSETILLHSDSQCAYFRGKNVDGCGSVKIIGCRRSTRLTKKAIPEDISSLKHSVGSAELCRRSTRLTKKAIPEDISSLKHSVGSAELGERKEASGLDPTSPCRKENAMGHFNRNHGFVRCCSNVPEHRHNKRHCASREAGYLATSNDDLPHEESVDDTAKLDLYRSTDALCCVCHIGVSSDFLVQCKNSGCFRPFHIFCLYPPQHKIEEDWVCPYCVEVLHFNDHLSKDWMLTAKNIQSIVGHKKVISECKEGQIQFLINWQSLSHHHDSWVPLEWLHVVDRPRLYSYQKKFPISKQADFVDHRKPEWFEIDRVIACRKKFTSDKSCEIWKMLQDKQDNDAYEFLVKWRALDYCDATWESPCTEELLAEVGELVKRHKRAIERTPNHDVASNSSLDTALSNLFGDILYGYQLQGVKWILSNFKARRNVILADEMGLGKTVQVVSFIRYMKQEKLNVNPVLIIAPKSILFQWEKEFRHWASDLNVIIYQGEKQSRRCIQTHEMYTSEKRVLFDALVTNYERVLLDKGILKKFSWSAIIIDEAHKIKRLDCKLASFLKRFMSDFRLLLTGTPLQNNLLELFALLHFIDPGEFSDPKGEAESFSSIGKGESHADLEIKISQIHELLGSRMLRRMKSDVLSKSIPVKKWVQVPCALTDSQRELYIDILEKNYKKLNKEIQNGRKIILNFILVELRKCCNHPYLFPGQEQYYSSKEAAFLALVATSGKLQLLDKLLPKLKEKGHRVLLFTQMTKMLDILEDFLISLGLAYYRIDGSTSMAARQEQMKEFNNPKCEVSMFLISTRAGGLGIDLILFFILHFGFHLLTLRSYHFGLTLPPKQPTADRVIIYDPDFNPFMDLQAQSRAHRIGQTRPVVVYQLITKCSVEEKILQKSKQKLAIENLVMNSSKKPTVAELHSVLLHGARKILGRKNLYATSTQYDDTAIENLLKLDPTPDEKCSQDETGYLGSIQSFIPENDDIYRPSSPKAEEWKDILGPVATDTMDAGFGRGKRQKKVINYECEDGSDNDEIYNPDEADSSSSDGSDDESAAGDELEVN